MGQTNQQVVAEASKDVHNQNRKADLSPFATKTNDRSSLFSVHASLNTKDNTAISTTHPSKDKLRTTLKLQQALKLLDQEMDQGEISIQRTSDRLLREGWKTDIFGPSGSTSQLIDEAGDLLEDTDKEGKPKAGLEESKDTTSTRLFDADLDSLKHRKLAMLKDRNVLYT